MLACLRGPRCHCSSFRREKLYFHCQAMKCLCMTAEHTTINLTAAELTGQKPMHPLLGTEHYQCMDSLFIRGSIRHCSLCRRTGYESDSKSMLRHTHTQHSTGHSETTQHAVIYTAATLRRPHNSRICFLVKRSICAILSKSKACFLGGA